MSGPLDVGFVPVEVPGMRDGTGAVETSRLLVERLSRHHDLTVYVASQRGAVEADLPATDRVEYVLRDDLPKLPHPLWRKIGALRGEQAALERHDLVHSYSSAFVPVLADLSVPTLSTLNSYLAVCPKADMLYRGDEKCSGPAPTKCATCIPATALERRRGVESELRGGYVALGQIPFVRRSMARADQVDAYHALSPHVREDYAELGFPGARTRVVPHFYDERFLEPDGEHHPGRPVELLYVGALREIKGVHVLLRALARIRERNRDVVLRIAGTGPDGDRLRELARSTGVAADVEWLGYVEGADLRAAYRRADVFVYPGLIDEPFGRVLLEALASRTPVLAADVGSTAYVVGPAGVRFEPGAPAALADALETLLEDYRTYADAVPDQLARFAPDVVEGALLDLYRAVAAGDLSA